MKRLLGVSVLALTTLFAPPLHATTDAIRIIRGTLVQPTDIFGGSGALEIQGTAGVSIDATLFSFFAFLGWDVASFCERRACLPGEVMSIRAVYASSLPGSGEVTIHGQTYSLWTLDGAGAELDFDGEFVLPEFTDAARVELSAPFTFSGSLQIPNRQEPGTYDVFELHGSGVATVLIARNMFTGGWYVLNVTYEFLPPGNVTEP